MRVGYQGEAGAYSARAVAAMFPASKPQPFSSVVKVFAAVEDGFVDFGVVPIENSHAGSINETYDLLVRHEVGIVAEAMIAVSHCLLAHPGTKLKDIKRVLSHSQALKQCEDFLVSVGAELVAVHDTAGAARQVAESGDATQAAVASKEAAGLYGLEVVAEGIEDQAGNATKFVAIGKDAKVILGAPDKTSIVFAVEDVPGALYRCLKEFADRNINITKIESRPSHGRPWHYHFYLDFDSAIDQPGIGGALEALEGHTRFMRVLGSYKRAAEVLKG